MRYFAWASSTEQPTFTGPINPRTGKRSQAGSLSVFGWRRDRDRFIEFGKARAVEGADPVTLSIDIGIIKLVLQHAAAVHGLRVSVEAVDLARYVLKRLGLIGKGTERDRRPTDDELAKLIVGQPSRFL